MAPNGLITKQLTVDAISMKTSFSLQRGIDGLTGFCETHHVTSERAHTVSSYLPAFTIALPHLELFNLVVDETLLHSSGVGGVGV
jgi:hypothetical protein